MLKRCPSKAAAASLPGTVVSGGIAGMTGGIAVFAGGITGMSDGAAVFAGGFEADSMAELVRNMHKSLERLRGLSLKPIWA